MSKSYDYCFCFFKLEKIQYATFLRHGVDLSNSVSVMELRILDPSRIQHLGNIAPSP